MKAGFKEVVEVVTIGLDSVGLAVLIIGLAVAFLRSIAGRGEGRDVYRALRQDVGKAILLGLEFLVAADIVRTVAVSPNFESATVLAIIVLIRTFLSMALEVELEGQWPWNRREDAKASR